MPSPDSASNVSVSPGETRRTVACLIVNPFTNDSRVLKTSRSLQSAGYSVEVVALHEAGLPERENQDGIGVRRIRLRSRGWSKWRPVQLIKYVEYVIRSVRAVWNVDIIHCNDLNTLPTGLIAKLLWRKCKVVYDCHEFESNHWPHQRWYSIKLLQLLERIALPAADTVMTVSESIADEYVKLYGITRPNVVMNCPYRQSVSPTRRFREELEIDEDATIYLYQGALGIGRGIERLVENFSEMNSGKRVLVLMGYGTLEKFVADAAAGSERVFYKPAVPPGEILEYTSSADVGICMIEDVSLSYRLCLPNKLFEYVMAGLPVIVSKLPELQRFVQDTGVGTTVDWDEAGSLEAAMNVIEESPVFKNEHEGLERLTRVIDEYCWETQEVKLLASYRSLCDQSTTSA